MKKYTLALAMIALLPIVSAGAYEYSQPQGEYNSARPVMKNNAYKKATAKRRAGGYKNIINNNFYYAQPAQYYTQGIDNGNNTGRDFADYYRGKRNDTNPYVYEEKQASQTTNSYSSQERKYFLAHPFFQPLKGHVGSVTDVSYARNNFDFDLLNGRTLNLDRASSSYKQATPVGIVGITGKEETSMFAVKEDLSFGLTDRVALVLMAQYDKTDVTFKDWSGGEPSDTYSKSGLNLFGVGVQSRLVDNDDWIVMAEAFFQHQKDTTNTFMGEVKAGYKVYRTTIYGVGRISYTDLIKGDTYGAYVENPSGDWLMLSYKTDTKSVFQGEGGLGAFAVLGKYFTLNTELTYGYYDWHDQLNIKGALGFQPADHFALNLYASTVLYDSAKGKNRRYMNYDVNPTAFPEVETSPGHYDAVFTDSHLLYTEGDYNIKNYNEWKAGVQAILYF